MRTEYVDNLLDILSKRLNGETNTAAVIQFNERRLSAVNDLGLSADNDEKVLEQLGNLVSADKDPAVRVAAARAIVSILKRKREWNALSKKLLDWLAYEGEDVCELAASVLDELGPAGKDALKAAGSDALEALWAKLGTANQKITVSNSIARAIITIRSNPEDHDPEKSPLLVDAFKKLKSSDPGARLSAITFLMTTTGWHLLMSSNVKDKVQNLLSAFRAVSLRSTLMNIISLIVDLTPDYQELFDHFEIRGLAPSIFKPWDDDTAKPLTPASDSISIVRWKQAVFLADPRVRNFVNERILKKRVQLLLRQEVKWYEFVKATEAQATAGQGETWTTKELPAFDEDQEVEILDRSAHSNWLQIRIPNGRTGWIEAANADKQIQARIAGIDDEAHFLASRSRILSLMRVELKDSDRLIRQDMITWLQECDQYFTPRERAKVASALWECVQQYGQGLRAYAAIDLRGEKAARKEAVKNLIDSSVNEVMIGGLLLKEAVAELDELYMEPGVNKDYPVKPQIMPFILGALQSEDEQVRRLALIWIIRKATSEKDSERLPGRFNRDLVTRLQDLADDTQYPIIQRAAREALLPITESHSKFLLDELETKNILPIDMIKELIDMRSPAVMSSLIRKWAYWIAETDKAQLVDATAMQMRGDKSAVLPLVERLKNPLPLDSKEENRLKEEVVDQQVERIYMQELLALLKKPEASSNSPSGTKLPKAREDVLVNWMKSCSDEDKKFSELEQKSLDKQWKLETKKKEFAKLFWELELGRRELLVKRRIALQLAEMSSPRFFESVEYKDGTRNPRYVGMKSDLKTHAVPYLAHKLPGEPDLRVREHMARTLANVGELEAVDALALAIVAEDRTKANRQEVLAEYYLEPSKRRSEQAAQILDKAVGQAKNTMKLIQVLSVATFMLGVGVVILGLYVALFPPAAGGSSVNPIFGLFASIGGIAGIITLLIKGPLNDIQNSIANLVQLEAAFTNFIWELNLNSTYIQSQYVQEGIITNDVVAATIHRMESAMATAMSVIALYAEEGRQRVFAHISALLLESSPSEQDLQIKVLGHNLKVADGQKQDAKDKIMVFINHKRADAEIISWDKDSVKFKLNKEDWPGQGPNLISLLIDGVETNALPLELKPSILIAGKEETKAEPATASS